MDTVSEAVAVTEREETPLPVREPLGDLEDEPLEEGQGEGELVTEGEVETVGEVDPESTAEGEGAVL